MKLSNADDKGSPCNLPVSGEMLTALSDAMDNLDGSEIVKSPSRLPGRRSLSSFVQRPGKTAQSGV
jgi:hypothetical protein